MFLDCPPAVFSFLRHLSPFLLRRLGIHFMPSSLKMYAIMLHVFVKNKLMVCKLNVFVKIDRAVRPHVYGRSDLSDNCGPTADIWAVKPAGQPRKS
uniref:Uncharacterized protein n=1 Tax=Oryza brachyantha TaxID=4533 RepID=J3KVP3_ORYBR